MEVRNVCSVIFSPCGGTREVLGAITEGLPLSKMKYDVTLPRDRGASLKFSKEDLVFFGFPVYGGRTPRNAPVIFETLSGDGTPAVLVAVYGNRDYDGALLDLHKLARSRGFVPVAASAAVAEHSLVPAVAGGRPDADDRAALAQFGREVLARVREGVSEIEAPGAYPNLSTPPADAFRIEADPSLCTECGICFQKCPNEAIAKNDLRHTDSAKCILCCACIKYCPEKARGFPNPAVKKMGAEHLKDAFTNRRDAEFFI